MFIATTIVLFLTTVFYAFAAYKYRLELADLKLYSKNVQKAYDQRTEDVRKLEKEVYDLRGKLVLKDLLKVDETKITDVPGAY